MTPLEKFRELLFMRKAIVLHLQVLLCIEEDLWDVGERSDSGSFNGGIASR
jgi:hypothetical protein